MKLNYFEVLLYHLLDLFDALVNLPIIIIGIKPKSNLSGGFLHCKFKKVYGSVLDKTQERREDDSARFQQLWRGARSGN